MKYVMFTMVIGTNDPFEKEFVVDDDDPKLFLKLGDIVDVSKEGEWWTGKAKVFGREEKYYFSSNKSYVFYTLIWINVNAPESNILLNE